MFKVGEKVVCIDDSCGKISGKKILILNEIYNVQGSDISDNGRLNLLINAAFWDANRFRKLDYDFAENLLAEIKESVMQNVN